MSRKVTCTCSKVYTVQPGLAKITCSCGAVLRAPEFVAEEAGDP